MRGGGQRMPDKDNFNAVTNTSTVRRLTPLECERLQGFPDGWTDIGEWTDTKGKLHKEADSPRYKALGNSIALPFWKVLAKKISAQYDRDITLGSLFDGIGGFPRVFEQINGEGSARWASEIEEFPIAVTKKHFPAMLHLGDITAVDWSVVEPVDVVTGGSPCQDLSIAGKRAGLAGERSGLYIDQIKCIKELRKADEQRGRTGSEIRPRFMVWENVPGAFSSNKGQDFAAVLEEAIRVIEPKAPPCKCLRRVGLMPGVTMMKWEDGALLGEYTMPSFGEYPSEENASVLSAILEDSPHPKYNLSEKACAGILNRAERRGKELPPELKAALITQSGGGNCDGS